MASKQTATKQFETAAGTECCFSCSHVVLGISVLNDDDLWLLLYKHRLIVVGLWLTVSVHYYCLLNVWLVVSRVIALAVIH
jgi:hypothetical protein